MGKNRRDFIRKMLALSVPAILPPFFNDSLQKNDSEFPSRILGKTRLKIPVLSMGTSSASSPGLIRSAYHAGVRLFFSATYYGEGSNEIMVGEGLKGLPRDSYLVGTAIPLEGYDTHKGILAAPLNINDYVKKADASLARFGLDYVDFLLFPYAGKRSMILDETLIRAMKKVKKQGKTRYIGIATHSYSDEALTAAADAGVYDIAMTAFNYKTENIEAMNKAIEYAVKKGMGLVAMKTTAGAFTDKLAKKPVNTNAALKWVLQNPGISSIVSGMSSLEELQKNIAMIKDLKISEQEIMDLKVSGTAYEPGLYCLQCRRCIPQCPEALEIPEAMRSYMYAYGYHDFSLAKHTYTAAVLPVSPCTSCNECTVRCTAGFDIMERMKDISRISNVPSEFLT